MRLVVDANILVSFFRDNPVRFIIVNAEFLDLQLFSPEHALDELKKNAKGIIKYSKSSFEQVEFIIKEGLREFIAVISSEEFKQHNEQAKKLSPHDSDKDTPYFALALKLNCGIWSNEPAFKKQSSIKIFSTPDLRKQLGV